MKVTGEMETGLNSRQLTSVYADTRILFKTGAFDPRYDCALFYELFYFGYTPIRYVMCGDSEPFPVGMVGMDDDDWADVWRWWTETLTPAERKFFITDELTGELKAKNEPPTVAGVKMTNKRFTYEAGANAGNWGRSSEAEEFSKKLRADFPNSFHRLSLPL